jgi:hypothetical protein
MSYSYIGFYEFNCCGSCGPNAFLELHFVPLGVVIVKRLPARQPRTGDGDKVNILRHQCGQGGHIVPIPSVLPPDRYARYSTAIFRFTARLRRGRCSVGYQDKQDDQYSFQRVNPPSIAGRQNKHFYFV